MFALKLTHKESLLKSHNDQSPKYRQKSLHQYHIPSVELISWWAASASICHNISFHQIQHGVVPIPKSSNKRRMEENFDIFDFELTPEEVTSIDSVNKNIRFLPFEK
jgi:hypothetical protein